MLCPNPCPKTRYHYAASSRPSGRGMASLCCIDTSCLGSGFTLAHTTPQHSQTQQHLLHSSRLAAPGDRQQCSRPRKRTFRSVSTRQPLAPQSWNLLHPANNALLALLHTTQHAVWRPTECLSPGRHRKEKRFKSKCQAFAHRCVLLSQCCSEIIQRAVNPGTSFWVTMILDFAHPGPL